MPGPLSALQISMNDQTRTHLQSWVRRPKTPSGLVRRARAVLLLEQGSRYTSTARQGRLDRTESAQMGQALSRTRSGRSA